MQKLRAYSLGGEPCTPTMRVETFSLTKAESASRFVVRSAGGGDGRGSHRYLVRPGPAFHAFPRPITKKEKKRKEKKRKKYLQEAMDMSRCCSAIKRTVILHSGLAVAVKLAVPQFRRLITDPASILLQVT
jgi:hypothetical protein